jgi:hypothetical protein
MTCKSLFFEPSDAKIAIRVRSTPSLASRSLTEAIRDKRLELREFFQHLAAARA